MVQAAAHVRPVLTFAAPLLKSTMFHHSEGALGTNRAVSVNQAYEHVLVRM
jgi:hypothetical protein